MRGTLMQHTIFAQSRGIIPAYAGNTSHGICRVMDTWDHPRVCGEHANTANTGSNVIGSSPRMRGTPSLRRTDRPICGIIPAYAGNTTRWKRTCEGARDHPRVCGEHEARQKIKRAKQGSSPRMRGTPVNPSMPGCEAGIIPAYAGNTYCRCLNS